MNPVTVFLAAHIGAISGSIGVVAGMPIFIKLGQIRNKICRFGLLGCRLGGRGWETPPPIRNLAPHLLNGFKKRRSPFRGRAEML
jgi:hypothetical protein